MNAPARHFRLFACALAAVLAAVPLSAQEEADGAGRIDDDTIVIRGENGEPVTIRDVQRQARDIAVSTGGVFETPLARFEDRLCPGVVGLEDNFAAILNQRLRENAGELGIRLLDDECAPNFIVVFTDDGGALMQSLIDDSPEYFRFLDSGQINDILEPGPVHVWTSVEPRTLTGMPIAQVRDLTNPPVMSSWVAHSRIYTTTRRDIVSVMITFDRAAVRGMTLGQLADYATMRGLAQTRPNGDMTMDSILTLFLGTRDDPDFTPPQRLTDFDRAYLNSLYADIPNLPAARKLSAVGSHLRRVAGDRGEREP